MNRIITAAAALIAALAIEDGASAQGFYKDIFMDSGINVTSRKDLPAARALGLSIETYYSAPHKPMLITAKDTMEQAARIIGTDIDENGILLYPDGAPRFKMIYVNGGKAGRHGNSLTEMGRQRYRDFVAGGGSYWGTCAGAYMVTNGYVGGDSLLNPNYLHIYPKLVEDTELETTPTGMKVENNSPLLNYYDFGGDMYIDSVYHNGGCYIEDKKMAKGSEILLRYDYSTPERVEKGLPLLTGKVSAWAWKPDPEAGRVVVIGSHPEGEVTGERLDLACALVRYAIDGIGTPKVKGELKCNETRFMNKHTGDHDPLFTAIGDRQYHHFTVKIPKRAKNIKVILRSKMEDVDLNLTMKRGGFAFREGADYKDVSLGANKVMKFASLKPGIWYIGVECATTVETVETDCGVAYVGRTDVLNGVPYSIQITWDK